MVYAILLTTARAGALVNRYVAYGKPRTVRLEGGVDGEVVVVTGGSSGLGLSIAQGYASRGVRVAVLDVREENDDDSSSGSGSGNVRYYCCDVGRREHVESTAMRIEKDVGFSKFFFFFFKLTLFSWVPPLYSSIAPLQELTDCHFCHCRLIPSRELFRQTC